MAKGSRNRHSVFYEGARGIDDRQIAKLCHPLLMFGQAGASNLQKMCNNLWLGSNAPVVLAGLNKVCETALRRTKMQSRINN